MLLCEYCWSTNYGLETDLKSVSSLFLLEKVKKFEEGGIKMPDLQTKSETKKRR